MGKIRGLTTLTPAAFQQIVLTWFDQHGRHTLPWQHPRTPYRVWISEIMLQQTQVRIVIPYFTRFMAAFSHCQALAAAPLDHVLHHWSGLGYYARARNLHAAAQHIMDQHQGQLPHRLDQLLSLPGIGRSTAGAILSMGFDMPTPILDGNVKRVLARLHGIAGWPGKKAVENTLWTYATQYTPQKRIADYTQAIMDLGAVCCTRTQPHCTQCPLRPHCYAYQTNHIADYPGKKSASPLPTKHAFCLVAQDAHGRLLLQRRPPLGIWGGLWSFPEYPAALLTHPLSPPTAAACQSALFTPMGLTMQANTFCIGTTSKHTFSHFHWEITPLHCQLQTQRGHNKQQQSRIQEEAQAHTIWYETQAPPTLGLAAPVQQWLQKTVH